jgi:hypothetical protein
VTRGELEVELKTRPAGGKVAGAGTGQQHQKDGGAGAQNGGGDAAARDEGADGDAEAAHVGEAEGMAGFHLGVAPADAAPPLDRTAAAAAASLPPAAPSSKSAAGIPEAKNAAFVAYKQSVAPERATKLAEDMAVLRARRQELKDRCAAVNAAKAEIDGLQKQVEGMQVSEAAASVGPDANDVVDSDAYATMAQLKAAKMHYRRAYDDVKELRTAIEPVTSAVQEGRAALVEEFQAWYARGASGGLGGIGQEEDYGEQFENMELQRILETDPESTAYFEAKKTLKRAPRKALASRGR